MTKERASDPDLPAKSPRVSQRELRLKAALKANMAKRKALLRAGSERTFSGQAAADPKDKE